MKHIFLFISVLLLCSATGSSQVQLAEQQPGTLFAYPLAPDTCATLESRCNYIISHFWDGFDISKPINDDVAFETTFRDFVNFFQYAHRNVVMSSVRDLVNKAQSNVSNLAKLGMVAERALYGPTAEYWSDEVYVEFIKTLAGSKQLSKEIRQYYGNQLTRINTVQVGSQLDFDFTGVDGVKRRLSDVPAKNYLLLFVDDDTDSTIGRLRLSTNVALNNMLNSGELTLVCLSLNGYSADWSAGAAGYADNWTMGCNADLMKTLDLRALPCCYLLDEQRTVLDKSLSVEGLLSAVDPNF